MGTCYSSNRLETNSSLKRPYDKSKREFYLKSSKNFQSLKSKSTKSTKSTTSLSKSTNCQLITPSYLATISSNQLIQLNNQTNELKPKNSKELNLLATSSSLDVHYYLNQNRKMIENKSKLISKLPKFNLNRQQVHDSSIVNCKANQISHFGANVINGTTSTTANGTATIATNRTNGTKRTALNADLLRLKNHNLGNNTKSSSSSLTNSEQSFGSSQSTNSTASYTNQCSRLNQQRKLTFTKSTSSSTLNERRKKPTTSTSSLSNVNNGIKYDNRNDNRCNRVISKQPTSSTISNKSALNSSTDHSSLNHHHVQFSHNLTKLPTASKLTTTLTSLPKPQIAQRSISNLKAATTNSNLPNNNQANRTFSKDEVDCSKKHSSLYAQKSTSIRPYSLKNASDTYQPYKKPYTRTTNNQDLKSTITTGLRYPYSESNLRSKLTGLHDHEDSKYKQSNVKRTASSNSSLPVPNQFRSSKSDLRNSNSSLNRKSIDKLNQLTHLENHQNVKTTRSLTLEKNENLEKENKRLSTSFESSTLGKDLNERINQVRSSSKLLNQTFTNKQNIQNIPNVHDLKSFKNQLSKQLPNSIETTDDSNSITEPISCANSANSPKSNSPNSSLTPDLSNRSRLSSRSKISPEHNRSDFLIDDEICDQPDLMFLNSKENSASSSPIKELINSRINDKSMNNGYKTNIRYSITELDSLKLKQELLSSSIKINNEQVNNYDKQTDLLSNASVSSSPEKTNTANTNLSPVKSFRKPRPLSIVESENGDLALDGSSFRSVMQDINGIKTLLFRLQGELQKSETQNPFENVLNISQARNQNPITNGLTDNEDTLDRDMFLKEEESDKILELENQNLKKQLNLLKQQMEEKDRTIRLLQQQMTKYLNINEANVNTNATNRTNTKTTSTSTCNATTQTDRQISEFKNVQAPESKAQAGGIVVRSDDDQNHLSL